MATSPQLARLKRRLDAIPKAVVEAVQPALRQSGDELVARMRQLAPEDIGALKASIVATPSGERLSRMTFSKASWSTAPLMRSSFLAFIVWLLVRGWGSRSDSHT